MPKRKILKNTSKYTGKSHHRSPNSSPSKSENEDTWVCGICSSFNSNQDRYCLQCYQSLYYYFYIDMHMFVERDYSFYQNFYPAIYSKNQS